METARQQTLMEQPEIAELFQVLEGNGLARIGSALVPFYNQMGKKSEIYKLMSTKPEDFINESGYEG